MIVLNMWFDINIRLFGWQMLPTKWRTLKDVAFINVLLKPIEQLYYTWYNWRIDNIYKLEHTGQVCSLRGSLNESFDVISRRIYISSALEEQTTYVHTEAEEQELFTNTEAENGEDTMYVYTEAETADTGLDFIVYVPIEIVNLHIHALKAHIEFYKAGGKRYAIIAF